MGFTDTFRKGGGFLNNVDGVITSYQFTGEFEAAAQGRGRNKKSDFNPLYCRLSVLVDGADADVSTHLFMGSADDFEISDDGQTITPVGEGVGISAKSEFGKFFLALVENGFPDLDIQPGDPITLEGLTGTRARFVQVTDEYATKKRGKRKGSDGKEYDRQNLVVSQVYSVGTEQPAPARKPAATGRAATKLARTTSAAAAPKSNGQTDYSEFTRDTLLDILSEKGDKGCPKQALTLAFTRKLMKDDRRDPVRKLGTSEAFLASLVDEGLITFDKTSKEQTVALVAE